ncbi:MAG: hypothetical protein PHI72_02850 [Atribacterota bacterium]|jgi:hypothetical protein|nr:hypothetical protein [Atribacterota bacterium]MDD4895547.1 hypothetical protein [Atribacterota bacterium]MDD5637157.1 hypothetical protein [Atribacterota bacterium]
MKKIYYLIIILIFYLFILFILSLAGEASEITMGGQLNASLTTVYTEQTGFVLVPQANLDLELFLPSWNNNEIKCAGYLFTDAVEGRVDFFWKKLYWKHRFEDFHLTIGRQPISWSFGSLLNPVDYTIGAVALDREYNPKFQNALEIYYPINWNTSLSLVASLPGQDITWKAGLRGRTLIKDFDVTINYLQEQIKEGEIGEYRFGITAKGDLGSCGVYSAFGYYSEEKTCSLLVGVDNSYFFPAGNQLYIQAEYLNIPPEILSKITGFMMSLSEEEEEKNIHLLASNISYKIDELSSIGVTALYNHNSGSAILMPVYSNQLSTNSTIKVQGGVMTKSMTKAEGSPLEVFFGKPTQIFLEISLNHSF